MTPSQLTKVVNAISELIGKTQAPIIGVVVDEDHVVAAIEGSSWWEDVHRSPMFVQKYDFQKHVAIYYPQEAGDEGFKTLDIHDADSTRLIFSLKVR